MAKVHRAPAAGPETDFYRVADAGEVLQREVGRRITMAHGEPRFHVVSGVARRRVAAVHSESDSSHTGQEEGLPVGIDAIDVTIRQGEATLRPPGTASGVDRRWSETFTISPPSTVSVHQIENLEREPRAR